MSAEDMKAVSAQSDTIVAPKLVQNSRTGGNVEPETGRELPQIEREELEALAAKLNTAIREIGRDLRFQVNMETGHSVIQVLDRETGEIIRQIPPEKATAYLSDQGGVSLRLFDSRV